VWKPLPSYSRSRMRKLLPAFLLGSEILSTLLVVPGLQAQEEGQRKATVRVSPSYPDLARRMNVSGTVRLEVTIAPDGKVTSVKPIGGHPVLVEAADQAVKKWKFQPSNSATTEVVAVQFRNE
jgi:TonB family protein